ncbi:MAG: FTR1 family protein [Dehalococcoidia bacterium]|jgi:high-affinity iron transporter|nr:FTR1 family protein [Dehalococcoidia bacterium]
MRKQARHIKSGLEVQVESALKTGSTFAMALLTFVVVIREGIETVLFLFSTWQVEGDSAALFTGGIIGLVVAIAVGYLGYKGSQFINLRVFFNVTAVLLVFFAAGLLAHDIHEFQEAGLFPILQDEAWNTNGVLNEKAGLGSFLKALLGSNGNPKLLEVFFYFAYLGGVLWTYFRPAGEPGRFSQPAAPPSPRVETTHRASSTSVLSCIC